jgi:hypothetical protein
LAKVHLARRSRRAVDLNAHVGRISDALAVDIDAAELADRPDKTRAPDPVVARFVARAANTIVAAPFFLLGSKCAPARQQKEKA